MTWWCSETGMVDLRLAYPLTPFNPSIFSSFHHFNKQKYWCARWWCFATGMVQLRLARPWTPYDPSFFLLSIILTNRSIGNVWWDGVLRLGWSDWGLPFLWLPPCLLFFLLLFLPTNRKVLQRRLFRTLFWWDARTRQIINEIFTILY